METVDLICGACGEINKRKPKPEPEDARECRQIYFICSHCRIKNYRDGTYEGQAFDDESEEPHDQEDVMAVTPKKAKVAGQKKSNEGLLWGSIILGFIGFFMKYFKHMKKDETPKSQETDQVYHRGLL